MTNQIHFIEISNKWYIKNNTDFEHIITFKVPSWIAKRAQLIMDNDTRETFLYKDETMNENEIMFIVPTTIEDIRERAIDCYLSSGNNKTIASEMINLTEKALSNEQLNDLIDDLCNKGFYFEWICFIESLLNSKEEQRLNLRI